MCSCEDGVYSEWKNFWNDREPHLATDWDSTTCYESSFETDSWWMTRLHPRSNFVTRVTFSGI